MTVCCHFALKKKNSMQKWRPKAGGKVNSPWNYTYILPQFSLPRYSHSGNVNQMYLRQKVIHRNAGTSSLCGARYAILPKPDCHNIILITWICCTRFPNRNCIHWKQFKIFYQRITAQEVRSPGFSG